MGVHPCPNPGQVIMNEPKYVCACTENNGENPKWLHRQEVVAACNIDDKVPGRCACKSPNEHVCPLMLQGVRA